MADNDIQNAIDAAAAEIAEESGIDLETPDAELESGDEVVETEEELQEEPEAELEDEGVVEAEDITPEEIAEAKRIYKALKDPASRQAVIRGMAQQAGILDQETPTTRKEVVAAKKSAVETLKASLPKDFAFLADALGPGIEKLLEEQREELVGSQTKAINQINNDRILEQTSKAMTKLSEETKGDSKRYESEMLKLANRFAASPGVSIEEYLRGLYTMASAGKVVAKVKSQMTERINKNAKDVPSRLQSVPELMDRAVPRTKIKGGIGGAVEFALKQLEAGQTPNRKRG
jgi:hypothetical protein